MRILLLILFFTAHIALSAQGPHQQLIELTKQEAQALASELHLNSQDSKTLSNIYVKHALAVEDLIVEGDPELDLLKEVQKLEDLKQLQIAGLLSEAEFQLYEYKMQQLQIQEASEFDSLQTHLNDPEFRKEVKAYFIEKVSPYLVYYHQTYLKPNLKQKHYFKINQSRVKVHDIKMQLDSIEANGGNRYELDKALENKVEKSIKELKRLRKKYKERLDYINVALGPVERQWNNDYIKMVQAHYKDEQFQRIESYSAYLNAYGIDYLVGEFSLLLFDVFQTTNYIEERPVLIDMLMMAR